MKSLQNDPPLITGLHHISLETTNWEQSLQFYQDFLGLKPVAQGSGETRRLQLLDIGGGVCLELTELKEPRSMPDQEHNARLVHLAFRVRGTAALMDKVRAAGYEITLETKTIHSGDLHAVIGFFKGPQGEVIEAFQPIPADSHQAA
jgi:catechol 2,3-dioxygenase-like lactoylglutathione lyase family enzyme